MQKNHFLLLKKLRNTESAQLCIWPISLGDFAELKIAHVHFFSTQIPQCLGEQVRALVGTIVLQK